MGSPGGFLRIAKRFLFFSILFVRGEYFNNSGTGTLIYHPA
jgi:hypothetical protein